MMASNELLDPRTRERIRRETARGMIVVLGIAALVMAALAAVAHHEVPLLAYWAGACSPDELGYQCSRLPWDLLSGAFALLALGGFLVVLYRRRRIPPTIVCESCGGLGWVLDLEAGNGECPRCGGTTFTYRNTFAGVLADAPHLQHVQETGMDGGFLVRRFRDTKNATFTRYY
jgi:hypothetical protein